MAKIKLKNTQENFDKAVDTLKYISERIWVSTDLENKTSIRIWVERFSKMAKKTLDEIEEGSKEKK